MTGHGITTKGGAGAGDYEISGLAVKVLFLFLVLPLLIVDAAAAEKLQVDVIPVGLRARNEAPIPVEVRFKWDSTRILEGQLEMEFHDGSRVLGLYRSGDLALTEGEQSFRMLLPPLPMPVSDSQVEVQLRFLNGHNVVPLDPTVLSVPSVRDRSLVVGLCQPAVMAGELNSDLVRSLLFERCAPSSESAAQKLLTTSVARLTPENLPAQALGYTTFDVVVLTAEAFNEAGERPLQALARWVRGGGSVCVFVGNGLQPRQLDFLNGLAEATPVNTAFLADTAGNLLPPLQKTLFVHSGVGRSVIVPAKGVAGENSDWRRITTFLWKVRANQARAIVKDGHWQRANDGSEGGNNYPIKVASYRPVPYRMAYSMQSTELGQELLSRLMPQTVRLIPFSALLGFLVLFVALIGPADYYVLGFLRRRKFTWILFPAMSIAFTVAMILMANHYLGLRDQRRSLTVVDLARDGSTLRWNRYELMFTARDKQVMTELKNALWAPLDIQAMTLDYNASYGRTYPGYRSYPYRGPGYGNADEREAGAPLYDGVLPVHFEARKPLRQWQPVLNRFFSFEPAPVTWPANWEAIDKSWRDLPGVRAKLSEKKAFNGDLYLINSRWNPTADGSSTGILPREMLDELCRGRSDGWFSVVSQVAPNGGGNFEDVPAMDTEGNDSALVIVTQIGEDIVVYRRFFYGAD